MVTKDPPSASVPERLAVKAVRVLTLPVVSDPRGHLAFGEYATHLPFPPRRYFVVFDVPGREVRGEHAHRRLQQVLVCLRGTLSVAVDDGKDRDEILLSGPHLGLYVPPLVWTVHHRYSEDAMLLVLASDAYDAADYIRSYEEFLAEVKAARG